ncbi:hypothetical protein CUMW_252620 [Citrus unshiu]|uniref:Protein kinase domain-containing protein n=1 Tax=Citrus unshiu TaxID=55188 RepID=A0A2H5QQL9_CITUN|nr:hypothetical protein CUMW_252620 [Citrus unshiu]
MARSIKGHIPRCFESLTALRELYLGSNKFTSGVPSSIWSLQYILKIDLSSNSFSGSLLSNIENLKVLTYLDLSRNKLSGDIPEAIGDLKDLASLSLAGNQFHGPIPESFGSLISLGFLDLSSNNLSGKIPKLEGEIPTKGPFRNFPGSFGIVYKGILSDGNNVAIKVFKLQLGRAFRSFDSECEVLRNVRHRNLLKILSSYSNPDFKALVLELMPNGSLENWLYSHNYFLDTLERLNIMIDVWLALEYLHHGHSSAPIVHCDLKPSNILLDENMVARVSDFGISKLLGDGEDSVTQTMTMATIGYMAPVSQLFDILKPKNAEFGSEGIISAKCDVYSFGVLLMETFTGKKPTDEMFTGEISLKNWVNESLPHALTDVVDANLMTV